MEDAVLNFSDFLIYDPSVPSGLVWKIKRTGGIKAGDRAGAQNTGGYWQVSVKGKIYNAHRIIWEMHNGAIPDGMNVDHRDRNNQNNNISNLRLATKNQNQSNRMQRLPSSTGVRGVVADRSRFRAQVKFMGASASKNFSSLEEADIWVQAKRKEMHGDFAVG